MNNKVIKPDKVKIISISVNVWTGKVYGLGDDNILYFWGSVVYGNIFFSKSVKGWIVELN